MKTIQMLAEEVEWYDGLIDFLEKHVPCLDELISTYNKQAQEETNDE